MQRAAMTRIIAPLCALLVAGCTLVDQRTFNPQAGQPARPPSEPGPSPLVPLVTIDLARANPDYAASLHQAVADAVRRKPDVQFDVITIVPGTGTTAEQVAAATGITADARAIARSINADGVDDGRIHLSARSDAGVTVRQVQVFVH